MVRAKLDVYYTFKVMSEPSVSVHSPAFLVHCYKWEEFGDMPLETYKVSPNNRSAVGGCSCPAWTANCKHRKCVEEAIKDGKAYEFHKWRWAERGGWEQNTDFDGSTMLDSLG